MLQYLIINQGLFVNRYIKIKDFFQNIDLGYPHFNGQSLIENAEKKMYKNHSDTQKTECKNVSPVIITTGSKNAKGELIAEKPSPQPQKYEILTVYSFNCQL